MKTVWLYTSQAEFEAESATRVVHKITSSARLGSVILEFTQDYARFPEIIVVVEDTLQKIVDDPRVRENA